MNKRSFFRTLLAAPLAVLGLAAVSSSTVPLKRFKIVKTGHGIVEGRLYQARSGDYVTVIDPKDDQNYGKWLRVLNNPTYDHNPPPGEGHWTCMVDEVKPTSYTTNV